MISKHVVVFNTTCLTVPDRCSRYSSRQSDGCMLVVRRSFEHHTGCYTIGLGSTQILRENTQEVVKASHLSSSSTNLTGGLAAQLLFRAPPCRKALYIYKHPCLLRDSNPGQMTQ
ncbi:hypothetical protein TNCV_1792951 [Trichonephila clavipes]|nr:hypothetical protein TNCV_1792951 [Trichonephila clavipes]